MTTTPLQMQARSRINLKHKIIERSVWGAKQPKLALLKPDWDYNSIVLHHSGNWGSIDPKGIELMHMSENNYDDVGYHYLIKANGEIFEGRKIYNKGSHVSGVNTGKIGVLLMGDYDEQWWDFDDKLSKSHISAANSLIKTLMTNFPKIRKLGGHKEFLVSRGYTCPGNLIMNVIDRMRKKHGLSKP